jgi:hypothetical protein
MEALDQRISAHQRKLEQIVVAHNNLLKLVQELVQESRQIHDLFHDLSSAQNTSSSSSTTTSSKVTSAPTGQSSRHKTTFRLPTRLLGFPDGDTSPPSGLLTPLLDALTKYNPSAAVDISYLSVDSRAPRALILMFVTNRIQVPAIEHQRKIIGNQSPYPALVMLIADSAVVDDNDAVVQIKEAKIWPTEAVFALSAAMDGSIYMNNVSNQTLSRIAAYLSKFIA